MKTFSSVLRKSFTGLCLCGLIIQAGVAKADDFERFILKCPAPYDAVIAAVESLGGKVTHQYDNVGAVAAVVPSNRRLELLHMDGLEAVYKDRLVGSPQPTELADLDASDVVGSMTVDEVRDALGSMPDDFFGDSILNGAGILHFSGITGSGVLVAVIDSGTANNPAVVPAIAGAVIGGENFVPGATEPSATSTVNDPHGTWVGSTLAANILFIFENTSVLVQSLLAHDPFSVIPDFPVPGLTLVPMIGTAPLAELYAMKVFPAAGGGAPESRIIAAMDRAITLRRNYNDGMPPVPVAGDGSEDNPFVYDSLPIEIVNMSLGGPTLFAGRDLEDQLTRAMLDVGITLVASAGNEGHAAMTGGSPGTGIGSLTVGAANIVSHERILRDLQFGLGIGSLYHPSNHHQTAYFSSRGPTADGRLDPDVTANGFANFAQGADGGLSVVSGTSFSAPTTAGAAALLRQAVPGASATRIRNSFIETANPGVLGDNSGPIDQGAGFIDVLSALFLLDSSAASEDLDFGIARGSVKRNINGAGFQVKRCSRSGFKARYENLMPGEVEQLFVRTRPDTSRIQIKVRNIAPELPPGAQNLFFGDDIFLKVQDAITSDEADPFADSLGALFINADTTLQFQNPQTGIVRVATMGDWTNAGRISVDVSVKCFRRPERRETDADKVAQGETDVVLVRMPRRVDQAVFELSWPRNWSRYPTDDLDMFLVDPLGNFGAGNFAGASINSPERVVLDDPMAGTWAILVDGFTVFGDDNDDDSDSDSDRKRDATSHWELRVTADGRRLRAFDDHDDDSDSDSDSDRDSDSDSDSDSDRDSDSDSD